MIIDAKAREHAPAAIGMVARLISEVTSMGGWYDLPVSLRIAVGDGIQLLVKCSSDYIDTANIEAASNRT